MQPLLLLLLVGVAFCAHPDSILLRDVDVLTFHAGQKTTARRLDPVWQLQCTNPNVRLCAKYEPRVAQCRNTGLNDRGEVQWKCEADLHPNVRFGQMDVVCEGYHSSEDESVLRGSCALEYRLEQVNNHQEDPVPVHPREKTSGLYTFLALLLLAVFAYKFGCCCCSLSDFIPEALGGASRSAPLFERSSSTTTTSAVRRNSRSPVRSVHTHTHTTTYIPPPMPAPAPTASPLFVVTPPPPPPAAPYPYYPPAAPIPVMSMWDAPTPAPAKPETKATTTATGYAGTKMRADSPSVKPVQTPTAAAAPIPASTPSPTPQQKATGYAGTKKR